METFDRKQHWENIYQSKEQKEFSWYQARPDTSISFFTLNKIPHSARIIDVGGGDSLLVDYLLEMGYTNLSVLDISAAAIEKAKKRLGEKAQQVNWIVADITEFDPMDMYDVWHDRAVFHFLTNDPDAGKYYETAAKALPSDGLLFLGTFSEQGPKKCSGIEIRQYSESGLRRAFPDSFEMINCNTMDHNTPFGTIQNFIFCTFRRI